jgi:hypothetical protein
MNSVISDVASHVSSVTTHTYYGEAFPCVIENKRQASLAEATGQISSQREELCRIAERGGAVLFRGFPLRTAEEFDAFVAAFNLHNFPYEDSLSNAVRVNKTVRVFTANEAPPSVTICLHHEMAQTPLVPAKLFFFCEKPAETGGATSLCRSDVLWERIEMATPEFAQNCVKKGLRYSHVMPSQNDSGSGMGRSWRSTLKAETKEAAERRLAALGYTYQWLPGDCLQVTTPVLPAVYDLPSGRRSFFNQLIAAYRGWKDARNDPSKSITFGDGTPLDGPAVLRACELADELTFDLNWQQGDVVLVDNFVCMHGRRTFSGTRKVLASLISNE